MLRKIFRDPNMSPSSHDFTGLSRHVSNDHHHTISDGLQVSHSSQQINPLMGFNSSRSLPQEQSEQPTQGWSKEPLPRTKKDSLLRSLLLPKRSNLDKPKQSIQQDDSYGTQAQVSRISLCLSKESERANQESRRTRTRSMFHDPRKLKAFFDDQLVGSQNHSVEALDHTEFAAISTEDQVSGYTDSDMHFDKRQTPANCSADALFIVHSNIPESGNDVLTSSFPSVDSPNQSGYRKSIKTIKTRFWQHNNSPKSVDFSNQFQPDVQNHQVGQDDPNEVEWEQVRKKAEIKFADWIRRSPLGDQDDTFRQGRISDVDQSDKTMQSSFELRNNSGAVPQKQTLTSMIEWETQAQQQRQRQHEPQQQFDTSLHNMNVSNSPPLGSFPYGLKSQHRLGTNFTASPTKLQRRPLPPIPGSEGNALEQIRIQNVAESDGIPHEQVTMESPSENKPSASMEPTADNANIPSLPCSQDRNVRPLSRPVDPYALEMELDSLVSRSENIKLGRKHGKQESMRDSHNVSGSFQTPLHNAQCGTASSMQRQAPPNPSRITQTEDVTHLVCSLTKAMHNHRAATKAAQRTYGGATATTQDAFPSPNTDQSLSFGSLGPPTELGFVKIGKQVTETIAQSHQDFPSREIDRFNSNLELLEQLGHPRHRHEPSPNSEELPARLVKHEVKPTHLPVVVELRNEMYASEFANLDMAVGEMHDDERETEAFFRRIQQWRSSVKRPGSSVMMYATSSLSVKASSCSQKQPSELTSISRSHLHRHALESGAVCKAQPDEPKQAQFSSDPMSMNNLKGKARMMQPKERVETQQQGCHDEEKGQPFQKPGSTTGNSKSEVTARIDSRPPPYRKEENFANSTSSPTQDKSIEPKSQRSSNDTLSLTGSNRFDPNLKMSGGTKHRYQLNSQEANLVFENMIPLSPALLAKSFSPNEKDHHPQRYRDPDPSPSGADTSETRQSKRTPSLLDLFLPEKSSSFSPNSNKCTEEVEVGLSELIVQEKYVLDLLKQEEVTGMKNIEILVDRFPKEIQKFMKLYPGLLLFVSLRSKLEHFVKQPQKETHQETKENMETRVLDPLKPRIVIQSPSTEESPEACTRRRKGISTHSSLSSSCEKKSISKHSEINKVGLLHPMETDHRFDTASEKKVTSSSVYELPSFKKKGSREFIQTQQKNETSSSVALPLEDQETFPSRIENDKITVLQPIQNEICLKSIDKRDILMQKALDRIIEYVDNAGELTSLQRSLISLHEKLISTTGKRNSLDARVALLEQAVFSKINP